MNMQTTTLKSDTEFTTGYRGSGLPTLMDIVPAGTVVSFYVTELNDGSKIYTALHPTKRGYTATRRVEPKKNISADVLLYDSGLGKWVVRSSLPLPAGTLTSSGSLTGSFVAEASSLGMAPGAKPEAITLVVGSRNFVLQLVDVKVDVNGEISVMVYEGVGPALRMKLNVLND